MQALLFVLALLPFSQGFAPAAPARWTRTSVAASAESASRREVMSGLGLALVAGLSGASPARAGYLNADTLPEVLKPDASMVDRDVLKTAKVQDAIKEVNFYLEVVKEVSARGLHATKRPTGLHVLPVLLHSYIKSVR
mmetsp:Transcript_55739/g.126649  ORF Transcript_55739/g.126649 Transcript_55739/m.126649 type:complete len:138 (+) Transcript_55739:57-470(+)